MEICTMGLQSFFTRKMKYIHSIIKIFFGNIVLTLTSHSLPQTDLNFPCVEHIFLRIVIRNITFSLRRQGADYLQIVVHLGSCDVAAPNERNRLNPAHTYRSIVAGTKNLTITEPSPSPDIFPTITYHSDVVCATQTLIWASRADGTTI